ncbi:hypothetical protein U9M48_014128 [Paspalum notatum var. saurae]|uniref:Uncharacterized protein n=1 Tax=Paspalum notatum var. saurae TaxID=547442 RepID=A0AAQ3T0Z1_PASNO
MDGRPRRSRSAHQRPVTSTRSICRSSNAPPSLPSAASRTAFRPYMRRTRFRSVDASSFFRCPDAAAAGDLKKHDAEAVDVRFGAALLVADELRVYVPQGPRHDLRCLWLGAVVDEPRQAEVAELGVAGGVEHHVAWLDVAVHDALVALRVEVEDGRTQAHRNIVPLCPGHDDLRMIEILVEAATSHKIVDNEETLLAIIIAPANELDNVAMPELAHDLDLGRELPPPLLRRSRRRGERLHRDMAVLVVQVPAVHRAEPASPDPLALGEVACGGGDRAVAEASRPHSRCAPPAQTRSPRGLA